jgi:hypothetical protein
MPTRIQIPPEMFHDLRAHLAQGSDEQLAFLLAEWRGEVAVAVDLLCVTEDGLDFKSPWHISLTDEERARVIKWAHEHDGALIEAHAHLGQDAASFSPSDESGLAAFVPHIWWRLGHRPYAALVFSEETFDAMVWRAGPDAAEPIASIDVGERVLTPTNITYRRRRTKASAS